MFDASGEDGNADSIIMTFSRSPSDSLTCNWALSLAHHSYPAENCVDALDSTLSAFLYHIRIKMNATYSHVMRSLVCQKCTTAAIQSSTRIRSPLRMSLLRNFPLRTSALTTRPLSTSNRLFSATSDWQGRKPDEHAVNRTEEKDVQSQQSQAGMREKERHMSGKDAEKGKEENISQGVSEADQNNSNPRAKEESPEAPGPVIGMNDERGGVSYSMLDVLSVADRLARRKGIKADGEYVRIREGGQAPFACLGFIDGMHFYKSIGRKTRSF